MHSHEFSVRRMQLYCDITKPGFIFHVTSLTDGCSSLFILFIYLHVVYRRVVRSYTYVGTLCVSVLCSFSCGILANAFIFNSMRYVYVKLGIALDIECTLHSTFCVGVCA